MKMISKVSLGHLSINNNDDIHDDDDDDNDEVDDDNGDCLATLGTNTYSGPISLLGKTQTTSKKFPQYMH